MAANPTKKVIDPEYFENQSKKYNETTRDHIFKIEKALRAAIKKALQAKYGTAWERDGIPKEILRRLHNDAFEKEMAEERKVEDWECATLKDFISVATYASNWSTVFESVLTRPNDTSKGRKEEKLAWINICDAEKSKLEKNPSYSVARKAFDLIDSVYKWLCE